MLVPATQLHQVFNAVRQDKHTSDDKGIDIFAANGDVDSLCAAYQLESLLGKWDFFTCITPVENYDALMRMCHSNKALMEAQDLKTVVLINCGATEDVRTLLRLPAESVRIIIIDAHRPIWHGHNVETDQTVLVLLDDDDPVPRSSIPPFIENDREYEDEGAPDDLSVGYGDEEDEEGGGPQGQGSSAREGEQGSQLSDTQGEGEAGTSEGSEQQQGGRRRPAAEDRGGPPKKRSRTERDAEWLKHKQAVAAYYESNAGYGKPSALLLLQLAHSIQQDDNFYIWLAILGVTDQYIHQRMDPSCYIRWRQELEGHVTTHNGELEVEEETSNGFFNKRGRHRMTVLAVKDLKVPLLKRWSLTEAMQHTNHVATRLQAWKETGKRTVELMLAAMNIPKPQRTADFNSMRPEVYPHLLARFKAVAAKFGLVWEALRYEGFEVQYKNDFKMLATDYALALTAVLGQPRAEGVTAQEAFRDAIDCLMPHKPKGVEALKAGIERAKRMAVAVVDEGGLLMSQHAVHGIKDPFWYLDLSAHTLQYSNEFHHHTALIKLAIFIRDAMAIRTRTMKPLFLVGPPNSEKQCYIVAVRDKVVAGTLQNNPFSVPLQEAITDTVGTDDVQVTFDASVYLIKQSAVHQVLAEVKIKIKQYKAEMGSS